MIFISYRNSDSEVLVDRLDSDLRRHFGNKKVFRDKTRLSGSQDWPADLEENAKGCRVMLVMIGENWETSFSTSGKFKNFPRLYNPEDWVRKEINIGLCNNECRTIPILINDTEMPDGDFLEKCELGVLHKKQAEKLTTDYYETDLQKLIKIIEGYGLNAETYENNFGNIYNSYLDWLVKCHERLEFRGVNYSNGGSITVELKQVYLALQADATNPLERAAARQNLISEIEAAIQNGEIAEEDLQHAEWLFIAGSPIMPSIESRDRINEIFPGLKELLNLGQAYYQNTQLVVLGDPGSGKTTLARWLSLVSAQALIDGKQILSVPLSQVDPTTETPDKIISLGLARIPILIKISEYAEHRQRATGAGKQSLLEFLGQQSWLGNFPVWNEGKHTGRRIDPALLNEFFQKALTDGTALVVLDGLDEIPASNLRDEIVEEVDSFLDRWVRKKHTVAKIEKHHNEAAIFFANMTADIPGNRILITSRIAGYHASRLRGNLAHVTIEPMSEKAVANFIHNWMHAVHYELAADKSNLALIGEQADKEAKQFLDALLKPRQRGGRELATNPLLCGILATVFRQHNGLLPQERVELYRQAVDLLLDIWIKKQGDSQESRLLRYELFDVLEPVAEHIHRHEPTGLIPEPQLQQLTLQFLAKSRGENPLRPSPKLRIAVDEIIRIIKQDVGLLAARGEGVYGFLHLTFQEYFAGRAIVSDPITAGAQVLDRMSDARWREAIRLGLGYLSIQQPDQLAALIEQILNKKTLLQDILPQSALMMVDSLPDLHGNQKRIAGLVVEELILSYSNRFLLERLPRRRELLEWGFRRFIDLGYSDELEKCLVNALHNISNDENKAGAAAEIINRLECFTVKTIDALKAALPLDPPGWKWPVHKSLRIAITSMTENGMPGMFNKFPLRNLQLENSSAMEFISGNLDWLRIFIALFGGIGDYNAAEGIKIYYQLSALLQQEEMSRNNYRYAFVDQWTINGDDDFIYNMAVYLDTEGKSILARKENKPCFDPQKIFKNCFMQNDLLHAVNQKQSSTEFLDFIGSKSKSFQTEYNLVNWIVTGKMPADDTQLKKLKNELLVLNEEIADAVLRIEPLLLSLIEGCIEKLPPQYIWPLFESSINTILSKGSAPLISRIMHVKDSLPPYARPYLLAEALGLYCQGWGDDGVYNTAVFLDTYSFSPAEFLQAHSVLPLSAHLKAEYIFWEWPISYLPPAHISDNDILPATLDNILLIPSQVGFAKQWCLDTVLNPIIETNPDLLPEVLAFALGNAGYGDTRKELFLSFAPELLLQVNPADTIYEKIKALEDDYYKSRALFRLSQSMPHKREILFAEAQALVEKVDDPLKKILLIELQIINNPGQIHSAQWQNIEAWIEEINDPDEQARAWARFGIYAPAERKRNYFSKAITSTLRIKDEMVRSTTVRLLRKSIAPEQFSEEYAVASNSFHDPIFKARAVEDCGSIFRRLAEYLGTDRQNIDSWAILSLAAQVDQALCKEQNQNNLLWEKLVADQSVDSALDVVNASDKDALQLTPLSLLRLEKILEGDNAAIGEMIFPALRLASREAIPFLRRQLNGTPGIKVSASALMLSEKLGLSGEFISKITMCFESSSDLLRNRAAEVLYGGKKDNPSFRTSLIGEAGLEALYEYILKDKSIISIHNVSKWFSEHLVYDSAIQIQSWANKLRDDPSNKVVSVILKSIIHIENAAFEQLLAELRTGGIMVQKMIFISLTNLAKHDRLLQPENLFFILSSLQPAEDADLSEPKCFVFQLNGLCEHIVEYLDMHKDEPLDINFVKEARKDILARNAFSWTDVCSVKDSPTLVEYLKHIGQTMYSSSAAERDRWMNGTSEARQVLDAPGFMELLTQWFTVALTENINNPGDYINLENAYIIELLASSATLAPARFLRCISVARAEEILVKVILYHRPYTGRSDSMRLLGYLRVLSLNMLPAIYSALKDVEPVREAAIETMNYFRQMEAGVLKELKDWLYDESGLVAYATARLLTAIARHAQNVRLSEKDKTAVSIRQEILEALADAIRSPKSNRRLDFGSNNFPTPDVPRLCDYFYDCMLKVAGYDDTRTTGRKEKKSD